MTTQPADLRAVTRTAATWPTIAEAAADCGVSLSTLGRAVRNHYVLAVKTNVTRVDPSSLAAWFASRQP